MKILILGGNGMIGHKIYQIISKTHPNTWVLIRKKLHNLKYKHIFNKNFVIDDFDLTDFIRLNTLLDFHNPDYIINAAGITIRRGVNDSIYKSIMINAYLPHFINEWVTKNNKKLIHFSTDCVFSGNEGGYTEDSITDSIDIYGRTKSLGEVISKNAITLRSSMIGIELENKTELFEWFLSKKNMKINGFSNVFYSGITTIKMAEYVLKIIDTLPEMHGLYNVSSESISKYELLRLLNSKFNMNLTILKDETKKSNKVLTSDVFFNYTGLQKPNWLVLVEELWHDYTINFNFSI
jgi:dTDP-4-dehydrorhamnose reductase